MSYRLRLSNYTKKQLKKMDRHIAQMLVLDMKNKLDNVDNPRYIGKALSGNKKGFWRYRFGNYRVICRILDDELVILAVEVGHRREIYK